jgi:magnesium chelatase family protein
VLPQAATERDCALTRAEQALLERAMLARDLSARAVLRIRRVARTLADLAGAERISSIHLAEALAYRQFDMAVPRVAGAA